VSNCSKTKFNKVLRSAVTKSFLLALVFFQKISLLRVHFCGQKAIQSANGVPPLLADWHGSPTAFRDSPMTVDSSFSVDGGISVACRAGLAMLLEAYRFAGELQRDIWDFAVEISRMRARGLTHNDLRWLCCHGYVEQEAEVAARGQKSRAFRNVGLLTFTRRSCFVLTEYGVAFAQQLSGEAQSAGARDVRRRADEGHVPPMPHWDRDCQRLIFRGHIIKQFKVPAPNQELILSAFQEEHWPVRIDDPLPQQPGLDPKRRLHETVTSLNRHQRNPLLRFLGDGSGTGVRWEPAAGLCESTPLADEGANGVLTAGVVVPGKQETPCSSERTSTSPPKLR
jgi:hypothetical protein